MHLPADSHVHTAWSWDAPNGSMRASCERALTLGLPAVAFTEHVDHTVWRIAMTEGQKPDEHLVRLSQDGRVHPPPFDPVGYLAEVEQCRDQFPGLRILSGLELGEPHRHPVQVASVLRAGRFDRVLGSLHSLLDGDEYAEPPALYTHLEAARVLRAYLAEITVLVESGQPFEVLAHIDYPIRTWPARAGLFDPRKFEEEFRHALRATASSGRVLEVNTTVPLHALLLRWWREEGGAAITFGSDAHDPGAVARGFRDAANMAEAHGFRAGDHPGDVWGRS